MAFESEWKFICEIAALTKDGEPDSEGEEFILENDDAVDTLHSLIGGARAFVAEHEAIVASERREAEYWRRINPNT